MISKAWCRMTLIVALALAAAACGQKGDLYLPDQKAAAPDRFLSAPFT